MDSQMDGWTNEDDSLRGSICYSCGSKTCNACQLGVGIGAAFRPRHLPFDAPSHTLFNFQCL